MHQRPGSQINNNKGIALIITILIIALIVGLIIEVGRLVLVDVSESAIFKERASSKAILISATNYAMAILLDDLKKNNYDSLLDIWADKKKLNEDFKEWDRSIDVEITIHDETGKLNINYLVKSNDSYDEVMRNVMLRLLTGEIFSLEKEEAENILDSIKDWIDKDDEPTKFGAESGYYKDLPNGYEAKNNNLDCLEEMLMIKGIGPGLYYGKGERPGLKDFLRVVGDGRININTASAPILASLSSGMDPDRVAQILESRESTNYDLSKSTWYKQIPGMAGVELPSHLITTTSTLFRIQSEIRAGARVISSSCLVQRRQGKIIVLDWKVY